MLTFPLLDHHLHNLTAYKQEAEFESFCRQIIQLVICPNLSPQTGPTGGGDSHVDSETYPVAEALANQWFVGHAREAARERWGFAFSAKKAWRPKFASDLAKIMETKRGYKKAFFVTNQLVRDRERAKLEDNLSRLHGIKVIILDRNWLCTKVIEGGHMDLAIRTLGLTRGLEHLDLGTPRPSAAKEPANSEFVCYSYLDSFADFADLRLRNNVDLTLVSETHSPTSFQALLDMLLSGASLQIIGKPGVGKSQLLSRLASVGARTRKFCPVLINSVLWRGSLANTLRDSVCGMTSESWQELLTSAIIQRLPIVFLVDGLNECEPKVQQLLLRALVDLRCRYSGVRFAVSSQDPVEIPGQMSATVVIGDLTADQRRELVECHACEAIGEASQPAVQLVSCCHDAMVLAEVLDRLGAGASIQAIYSQFVRLRLGSGTKAAVAFQALVAVARHLRENFQSFVSVGTFDRLMRPLAVTEGLDIYGVVQHSRLTRAYGDRISFCHELVCDFFASEGLVQAFPDVDQLLREASRPRNLALAEFVVGSMSHHESIRCAILTLGLEERLLDSVLIGRCGQCAVEVAEAFAARWLDEACKVALKAKFALPSPARSEESGQILAILREPVADLCESEWAPFRKIAGWLAVSGPFIYRVFEAFGTIDAHLQQERARLRERHPDEKYPWMSQLVQATYHLHWGLAGLGIMIDEAKKRVWVSSMPAQLVTTLEDFRQLSFGQLLFLAEVVVFRTSERPTDYLPDLANYLWRCGCAPVRLASIDFVHRNAPWVTEETRSALLTLLEGFLGDDPITNSLLFDAIGNLGGPSTDFQESDAEQEFLGVLEIPNDDFRSQLAFHTFCCLFDHPCSSTYFRAYELLPQATKHEFLRLSLEANQTNSFFFNSLVRMIAEERVAGCVPWLFKLAEMPIPNDHGFQDSVCAFMNAVLALRDLNEELPLVAEFSSSHARAWCWAARIVYFYSGSGEATSRQVDLAFHELIGLGRFGFDPIYQMLCASCLCAENVGQQLIGKKCKGLLQIARQALGDCEDPESMFEAASWGDGLKASHLGVAIRVIEECGDLSDVQSLMRWQDHPKVGKAAVQAVRALDHRREMTFRTGSA